MGGRFWCQSNHDLSYCYKNKKQNKKPISVDYIEEILSLPHTLCQVTNCIAYQVIWYAYIMMKEALNLVFALKY